jgi:hypothetical protein
MARIPASELRFLNSELCEDCKKRLRFNSLTTGYYPQQTSERRGASHHSIVNNPGGSKKHFFWGSPSAGVGQASARERELPALKQWYFLCPYPFLPGQL